MSETLTEFYAKLNAGIIKKYLEFKDYNTHQDAIELTANEFEKLSPGKVDALIYNKKYPYAKEAWAIVNAEKNKKKGKATKVVALQNKNTS